MNSRPTTPLSGCLEDLDALTPGHFLIGTSFLAVLTPGEFDDFPQPLRHWRLVQEIFQHS